MVGEGMFQPFVMMVFGLCFRVMMGVLTVGEGVDRPLSYPRRSVVRGMLTFHIGCGELGIDHFLCTSRILVASLVKMGSMGPRRIGLMGIRWIVVGWSR